MHEVIMWFSNFTHDVFTLFITILAWLGMGFVILLVIAFFMTIGASPDLLDRPKGKYDE